MVPDLRWRPAVVARLALTLVVGLATVGCSDDDTAGPPTPTSASTTSIAGSAGCANPTLTAGTNTIEVRGTRRQYQLALPDDADQPAPVVVDLHGFGATAAQQELLGGMAAAGTARGFIVATPESATSRNAWELAGLADSDDAAFIGALLDEIEARLCADPAREVVAGMSNGGGHAVGLICALGGRLAGIAPIASVNILRPCAEGLPTTILAFHGTEDGLVPYAGGAPLQGLDPSTQPDVDTAAVGRFQLLAVEDAVTQWAQIFGCGPARDEAIAADVRLRSYDACEEGVTVRLYTVEGGGHTWPGGTPVARLGATSDSIDATALVLDAFAAP